MIWQLPNQYFIFTLNFWAGTIYFITIQTFETPNHKRCHPWKTDCQKSGHKINSLPGESFMPHSVLPVCFMNLYSGSRLNCLSWFSISLSPVSVSSPYFSLRSMSKCGGLLDRSYYPYLCCIFLSGSTPCPAAGRDDQDLKMYCLFFSFCQKRTVTILKKSA